MAFTSFAGSFTAPGATGSQSVTGVGFQPKVVLFLMTTPTLGGTGTDATRGAWGFGMAASSSDRRVGYRLCIAGVPEVYQSDTHCIAYVNTSLQLSSADLTSFDSDGFTLNWDNLVNAGVPVLYMALGGSDLTNAKTGRFTLTATGSKAITGLGFKPDCVLFCTKYYGGNTGVLATTAYTSFGAATSSGARWYSAAATATAAAPSNAHRTQKTSQAFAYINETGGAIYDEFDFTSMDSDGFTVNVGTTLASGNTVEWLAIKGGQFKAGSFSEATSTGSQAVTGVGFAPAAIMLSSVNAASSSANQSAARMSVGFGTSSTRRGTVWVGDQDAANPPVSSSSIHTSKVLEMYTEGTPTLNDSADLTSLDSDGFTLNWGTVSGTAKEVCYLAFGAAGGGGDTSPAVFRYVRNQGMGMR